MTSIVAQQRAEEREGLVLRRRSQWNARFDYTNSRPVDEPATRLFLHITITNPSNYRSNDAHARAVEAIGISRFPNTGVSYNAGVMPDASAYEFQPVGRRGAHTVNDKRLSDCVTSGCSNRGSSLTAPSWNLNINARSVVLCQNVDDEVTRAQIHQAAKIAAAWKRAGFVHRRARWHGHRCVAWKSCPGDKAWRWMSELENLTEFYYVNGLGGDDDMPYTDWPQKDKDAFISDLKNAIIWDRAYDYVNEDRKEPTTLRHQVAAAHRDGFNQPKRVWTKRWPWRKWIKEENPDLVKNYKSGYTMQALLQNSYGVLQRFTRWDWLVNTLGRAVLSRRFNGTGRTAGLSIHETREITGRTEVKVDALTGLVTSIIERDPANHLTSEEIESAVQSGIENGIVHVQVSVSGPPADDDDDGGPNGPEEFQAANAIADDNDEDVEEPGEDRENSRSEAVEATTESDQS